MAMITTEFKFWLWRYWMSGRVGLIWQFKQSAIKPSI